MENQNAGQYQNSQNTPQNTQQGKAVNPFDSSVEEGELASLMKELQGIEETKKADFAKYLSQNLTPEEKELFFEDEEAFFQNILNKEEVFLREKIGDKQKRAEELEKAIAQKHSFGILEKAESEFLKRHPNVNVDEMIDFYENDLQPREKRKLDKLEPDEFFESLFSLYERQQSTTKKEGLPKRTKGTPMDVENADYQSDDGYFDRI